ncbi:MAG: hypothetical protein ABL919_00225 [Methylococcales bacterium]|nr:hypothetical protein [Methylococcaceae bacterium]
MSTTNLFCTLSSTRITKMIVGAQRIVCYAGPGIQFEPAQAMVNIAAQLGPEMLTVCVDFDERVMRMGYGELEAVNLLRAAGIIVNHAQGMRQALIIVDDEGYSFTPTPLYLEAESTDSNTINAIRLSNEQVKEALARLSPAAKAIAIAQAVTPEEKRRISDLPVDVNSSKVEDAQFIEVGASLKQAPPVKFDVARQVRVFEPYFQYVELNLIGAAIQRHRLAIPPGIQKLGGSKDLEGRLKTTFELIEKDGKLSSKPLENDLNQIRKDLTRSLGKSYGRVVLKAAKPHLVKRIEEFRTKLVAHQISVAEGLQKHLDDSRDQIVDYYKQHVIESPPDELVGQITGDVSENDAKYWLKNQLDRVFPTAQILIQDMKLEVSYKDLTFETLNQPDFLSSIKEAYPMADWDKTYNDYTAAGEAHKNG